MELIIALFGLYSGINDMNRIHENVADWLFEKVNTWSRREPSQAIERQVAKMARVTEEMIRSAAAEAFKKNPQSKIPPAKREEMIGLMINMARNVRTQASLGSVASVSGYFRSERLLDLLLGGVEPVRHANEAVAPGSPWILKRHLGMGSFGEVWLAENPHFPTPRAYKFFTKEGSGEWLEREQASLVAILKRLGEHDQIVTFEDVQVADCKYPFLAFEYLAGGSLEEWILKDPTCRPPLDPAEIVRQIARGLAAAHAEQIQHRDVKPANILLTAGANPEIKIGDFGLARVAATTAGPRAEVSFLASLGGTVGTSLYLPPEAQQRSYRRKAAQDDVFAVGVVWFQLILGAIERPSYDFAARLTDRGVDSHTIRLIERCLAHPDRRFKDAGMLLEAMAEGVPPVVPCPPGTPDVQYLAREFLASMLVNVA